MLMVAWLDPFTFSTSEHTTLPLSAPTFICLGFFLTYRATLLLCTTPRCAREITPCPQEPLLIEDENWCINFPAPSPLRWDDSEVPVSDKHSELPKGITLQSPTVLSCLIKSFTLSSLGYLTPNTPSFGHFQNKWFIVLSQCMPPGEPHLKEDTA